MTFESQYLVGVSLMFQREYTEAERLMVDAYEGMKAREAQIPPEAKQRLQHAIQDLADLYEATNQVQKAAKWRAKLE